MPKCPGCQTAIEGKDLRKQFGISPFRTCPYCKIRFTVDPQTKLRQLIALVLATASLALTVGWCFAGQPWLYPTVVSYITLALFIWWSNRLVEFIEHG